MGERKFVQMVLVTWPRWPPCPYMVKALKHLLLWNQMADDLETWYAASVARVLPMITLGWPLPILRQCQIWSLMLLYGKKVKPEDHWSCIAQLSAEGMLKSAVIEEKKFEHSPWAGADNPLGPKLWCQQEGPITMVIYCKFKKNLFNLWLNIHLFVI